jgi:carbamoyl-phosphate synthase small subunit
VVNPDFLSNGPGDPGLRKCYSGAEILSVNKPLFGICLGHQLLVWLMVFLLIKCLMVQRDKSSCKEFIGKGEITSQNHGFAVNRKS